MKAAFWNSLLNFIAILSFLSQQLCDVSVDKEISTFETRTKGFSAGLTSICNAAACGTDDIAYEIEKGPVPHNERLYVVHGWRWHTASVIRDVQRFTDKVKYAINGDQTKLTNCYNFVYDFNWKALIRYLRMSPLPPRIISVKHFHSS